MDADRWERRRERWERRQERRARRAACYSPGRHLFAGIVFVSLGVIFLLGNMGLVNVDQILRFWPVILIAMGAYRLVEAGDDYGESSGIFWIVIGGFFLLGTMGILSFAFRNFWPVILIGLGSLMLWRSTLSKNRGKPPWGSWDFGGPPFGTGSGSGSGGGSGSGSGGGSGGGSGTQTSFDAGTVPPAEGAAPKEDERTSSNSHFTATALLGGFDRKINSQDFRGGEVTAFMGGGKINLRRASITAPHVPVIRVFAMFGGIEILVPDDWTVISEVDMILGGFDDKKTDPPKVETKRLIIRGQVIMGGIEVKN